MSAVDRFESITVTSNGEAAARRIAERRRAAQEGMRRLAVIFNGKPLGSITLQQLPDFCGHVTGGGKP